MSRQFSYAEAAALLPEVFQVTADIIDVRADLAELGDALTNGTDSPLGGVAEMKALEARLHELLGWFPANGIEVKGAAPVVIDFPGTLLGADVLLCWLEGEPELAWYHRPELGFLGRRRLPPEAMR
ncbi:MAG TPA: DUF2203 domain-containing protein [Acidothermaceae bacterium]|nr:DUF2203 domain-containing protein [Acidothermaceae bacterium]